MRSIVIAFLVWHFCFPNRITCSTTENAPVTLSERARVDVKNSSEAVNATVSENFVETPRSEAIVEPIPLNGSAPSATGVTSDSAGHDRYWESNKGNEVDVSPRGIDLSVVRLCTASRNCDSALNERCVSADRRLVCGCERGYHSNELTKICELSDGVDADAVEYGLAWQEHKRLLRETAVDRTDKEDSLDAWKIYGQTSLRDILENTDETEAHDLEKETKNWLQAELERVKQECPPELVFNEPVNNDEILRNDEDEIATESQVSAEKSTESFSEVPLRTSMKPKALPDTSERSESSLDDSSVTQAAATKNSTKLKATADSSTTAKNST